MNMGIKTMFVLLLLFTAAFATISVTGYTVSQTSYRPGGQGYIAISVANPSTASADAMTGVVANVNAPPELVMTNSVNIGDIQPQSATVVTLPFKVKSDAKNGFYSVTVKIGGYSQTTQSGSQSFYSQSVSVPITVVNLPVFSTTTEQTVLAGVDEVQFIIKNNGGAAKDAIIRIDDTSGVALYGANQVYLGDITGTKQFNLTLDSRSATDGPLDIPLVIQYYDDVGSQQSETLNVRMTIKKEQLDLSFIQDGPVITRKEGPLTLRVKNNGNDQIEDRKSVV